MKGSRVVRVLIGIFALVLFSVYSFLRFSTSPHSDDFDTENAYIYSEVLAEIAAAEAAGVEYVPAHEREAQEAAAAAAAQAAAEAEAQAAAEAAAAAAQAEADALAAWEALGLPEVDLNSWEFVLVNSDNLLSSDFAPPTITNVSDSQCPVDSRIADALAAFADAARAQGLPVYLSSGYRAYSEQEYLYNRKIAQGYAPEDAARIVAYPGSSEHQTGLCCDITDYYRETKSWEQLEPTATYQWMSQHCHEYGFIVRYPKDKSGLDTNAAADSVTGIIYEPWHYRYVGVEAATYIMENKLCLEEFIELIKQNPRPVQGAQTTAGTEQSALPQPDPAASAQ